ncbi:esterase-like activity of phytase family protein [Pseudomonas sp. F1_0610]|uniref:esterase-like activity of phytase family protein n=1 Tax=Pseudomonas sp. F1_0610 TaxID=3114284 RepID=UPI0039C27091
MSIRSITAGLAILFSCQGYAEIPKLNLLNEYVVDGVKAGNLSGLAYCQDQFWTVSDKDDEHIYQLEFQSDTHRVQAIAQPFSITQPPMEYIPLSPTAKSAALWRAGDYDFEGISCDEQGNKYLVSESTHAVLQIRPDNTTHWVNLPSAMFNLAKANGLLKIYNAGFEGIALNPDGTQMWLAAERQARGIFHLKFSESPTKHIPDRVRGATFPDRWECTENCLFANDNDRENSIFNGQKYYKDFTDLVWFRGKIYSLERLEHQICRRDANTGEEEQCWSFAQTALLPDKLNPKGPFGIAEGLWISEKGAWIVLDNNQQARADGEQRPIIWHFAAPQTGWQGTSMVERGDK